jgi:hypothetical protein
MSLFRSHLKVIFKKVGDICPYFEGVSNPFFLILSCVNPEESLMKLGPFLFELEIANDEANQVGHHRNGLLKLSKNFFAPV